MKRNCNPNLIKIKHSYNSVELAEVFKIHIRTVQSWRKAGLKTIDENSKPYLFYGEEIRRFIKETRLKSRHPLKIDEFYCPRCRQPRKSLEKDIFIKITNKMLGKTSKQAILKGKCSVCNCSLNKYSSETKVKEFQNALTEHKTGLTGNGDSSLNTDIGEVQK